MPSDYKTTELELCSTFDGRVWASEFVARFGGDEDLMHAWFANAIMAGHDIGRRNQESEIARLRAENEQLRAQCKAWVVQVDDCRSTHKTWRTEVERLRATALTASEAMQIIVRLENGPNAFIPDKGVREKLDRIAHSEPPGL